LGEVLVPSVQVEGLNHAVDDQGYLRDPAAWSEDVARHFAVLEGIGPLTADHWKVIRYLHDYYVECGVIPVFRKICKGTGLKLKDVYALFPPRPMAVACRLAGLPKP
jgi:TusE/DsrC/DsvC family sulfur relay protein